MRKLSNWKQINFGVSMYVGICTKKRSQWHIKTKHTNMLKFGSKWPKIKRIQRMWKGCQICCDLC